VEGTPNFRDLGGYETSDGHFVQWGKIYRSGVLSFLTPTDLSYLSQLGIRVVCDFRTQQENDAAPEKWVADAEVDRINLPIGNDSSGHTLTSMQTMLATNPTPAQLRDWMTKTYSDFAFRAAPEYAKVFVQLKEDKLPLLYHCSGGKDRTGVFTALLLLSLGVPEDTVLADYALTTNYLRENTEANRKMMASTGLALSHLTREQRDVLMAADPEYLSSTLRAIDAKYGSFDNYRRQALGVSDSDVETLRARLLTK
jgi:protein-tyrosine phosphatase